MTACTCMHVLRLHRSLRGYEDCRPTAVLVACVRVRRGRGVCVQERKRKAEVLSDERGSAWGEETGVAQ